MSGKKGSKQVNSKKKFLEIIDSIIPNENGCKLWELGKDKDGYGYYSIRSRIYRSHRFLYIILNPGDYEGLVIMHSCDNPSCCNINHLSVGTFSENTLDMVKKGRNVKGSLVGTSKLSDKDVEEIRLKYPQKNTIELSKEYGVCKQTICNVLNCTTFVNASIMDEVYDPINKPIRIIL